MCETFLARLYSGDFDGLGQLDEIVAIGVELGITTDAFAPDVGMLEAMPDAARLSLFDAWEGLTPAKGARKQAEQLIDNWDEGWIPPILKVVELDGVSF